jgi:hypothetical protein
MKYAAIVLSKDTLQKCVDNFWDFQAGEIDQIRKALHAIKLEERYEQTPSGVTPWGEPLSEFNKTLGRGNAVA